MGLYADSSGVHSKATRPTSTSVMAKSKTEAMGGGARSPSLIDRRKSRPDITFPASAVVMGSNHVMRRVRSGPQLVGVGAGVRGEAGDVTDVIAAPRSTQYIASYN